MRDVLSAIETLPFASLALLAGPGGIVVLAPHPDDESIGCGGLIASALAEGRTVHVVVLTDGTGSHPNSPSHPPDRLAAVRRAEVTRAVGELGGAPTTLSFLGLPDTAVPNGGPTLAAAVADICAVIDRTGATALFVTWAHDPHCDHEAAAAMAAAVGRDRPDLRIWHYPIWGLHRSPDETIGSDPRGFRLDIAAWLPQKRRAIASHASQLGRLITDDPTGFALTEAMLAPFHASHERFLEPEP